MKFACALTRETDTEQAGRVLLEELLCRFDGPSDLMTVFFTPDHIEGILEVLDALSTRLSPRCLVGCSCEGVIGVDQEVERRPAISVLVGSMPGVKLQPFHLDRGDWGPLRRDPSKLNVLARPRADTRAWIALGDPYTTPVQDMFPLFEANAPGCPVVGGMASGGQPGQNVLVLNDRVFTAGLVGLTVSGAVKIDTVVSQGCRPIGRPLLVTGASENLIEQLGGKPAIVAAREIIEDLAPDDRDLLENGLFLGVVINEYQAEFNRGDFLVRNLLGADPENGVIAVSEAVSVGQTVQFHLRDAASADEDLRILMKRQGTGAAPAGGLLFTCNGRGTRLFDRASHDIMAVLDAVPSTPMAGFFAAGEIGPVGGRSFIHGHTASVVLFREENPAP